MSGLGDPDRGTARNLDGQAPAMPAFRPHDEYGEMPVPLVDGLFPTIGWQWLPEKKGGPVFAVIIRTRIGGLKAQERFPLTEEGWDRAWLALVSLSPPNAAAAAAVIRARPADDRDPAARAAQAALAALDARSLASLPDVAFLGGYAPEDGMVTGGRYDLRFLDDRQIESPNRLPDILTELPYRDIAELEIGGPGVVKKGGGYLGSGSDTVNALVSGGAGTVRALEGMAIGAVLNALTTRTTITTVVRVQASDSELFLLETKLAPEQLRMRLSRPLGAIRAARATAASGSPASPAAPPVEELAKLASMLASGLLTREEFETLKARLLSR